MVLTHVFNDNIAEMNRVVNEFAILLSRIRNAFRYCLSIWITPHETIGVQMIFQTFFNFLLYAVYKNQSNSSTSSGNSSSIVAMPTIHFSCFSANHINLKMKIDNKGETFSLNGHTDCFLLQGLRITFPFIVIVRP